MRPLKVTIDVDSYWRGWLAPLRVTQLPKKKISSQTTFASSSLCEKPIRLQPTMTLFKSLNCYTAGGDPFSVTTRRFPPFILYILGKRMLGCPRVGSGRAILSASKRRVRLHGVRRSAPANPFGKRISSRLSEIRSDHPRSGAGQVSARLHRWCCF